MKLRSPLYAKLLLLLLLELVLVAGLFFALPGRAGLGWNMLLSPPVRERLLNIGERIGKDLSPLPESGWDQVLSAYSAEYSVAFSVERAGAIGFFRGGPPPGDGPGSGPETAFVLQGSMPPGAPPEFAPEFKPGAPPPGPPPGGADHRDRPESGGTSSAQPQSGPGPPPDRVFHYGVGVGTGPLLSFTARQPGPDPFADRKLRGNLVAISHGGSSYELRIPAVLEPSGGEPSRPLMLQARAAGLGALLGFLGVTEWLLFALLVLGLSALLWWPFIWGITRTVVRLTRATGDIADGRFDTRVETRRRDELGSLADSVNRMAQRLQRYVSGQKQFLADIAHEVTSPLARMQLGLGILESRLGQEEQATLRDVQEDAQQMSRLLDELLLFSRAGMEAERAPPAAVELRPLLLEVLRREDPRQRVRLEVEDGLRAMARPAMLERAAANLVRNALRYGGEQTVEVTGLRDAQQVRILVRDRGPGVPEAALPRLGEPFFRPEVARDRDSGGTGLGLAIVRRCVEACAGTVAFRNREGGGFEAEIRLRRA